MGLFSNVILRNNINFINFRTLHKLDISYF